MSGRSIYNFGIIGSYSTIYTKARYFLLGCDRWRHMGGISLIFRRTIRDSHVPDRDNGSFSNLNTYRVRKSQSFAFTHRNRRPLFRLDSSVCIDDSLVDRRYSSFFNAYFTFTFKKYVITESFRQIYTDSIADTPLEKLFKSFVFWKHSQAHWMFSSVYCCRTPRGFC